MGPSAADGQNHYFSRDQTAAHRPRRVQLTLADVTLDLQTDSGVFSGAGIDPGTKYLLMANATPPAGAAHLLDLGCGYGAIALTLASRAPEATVWAVDVNPRALALTRENATSSGLANVQVALPEDVPADIAFDAIYSNPPIRIGKAALHEILETWLDRLGPGGTATLVVNKNLGSDSLHRWLQGEGWSTDRLSSRYGYRLLEARAR
jgi:16S rRNA (guanine1207-N2)-methyltransferase